MDADVAYVAADTRRTPDDILIGRWEVSVCGCCVDVMPNCCMATCLHSVSIAQIVHRMNIARFNWVVTVFLGLHAMEIVFGAIAVWTFLQHAKESFDELHDEPDRRRYTASVVMPQYLSIALFTFAYAVDFLTVWWLRAKVRHWFQIPGHFVVDCFLAFCCTCCSIAQIATHVKSYKRHQCDFGPTDTLAAYK